MKDEKEGVLPDAEAPTPETTEQLDKPDVTLPDEPVSEVEKLKAEKTEILEKLKAVESEKEITEKRLKDNQEYISRTRNVEKAPDVPRPVKTLDDYIGEVKTKFQDDPAAGLEKVIRDLVYDRDLERAEKAKEIAAAEERAFKKMLAINPESSRALKEIEKLDDECPDLQGLSYERKLEFINLRNGGVKQRETDAREKVGREASLAGGVGGSNIRGGSQKIPSWVNDPDVVREAQGKFKTKQELLNWADPNRAKEMYERSKQR
jgi:hypothetical protein